MFNKKPAKLPSTKSKSCLAVESFAMVAARYLTCKKN